MAIQDKISNCIKRLDNLVNNIEEFETDLNSGKVEKEIILAESKLIKKDYEKIFKKAVRQFYKYQPQYYAEDRQFSLYDMYSITYDEDGVSWETDGRFVKDIWRSGGKDWDYHRIGPDYIFEKMFVEGWHGGATPSKKRDYFRRPYPSGYEMAYRTPYTEIPRKKKDRSPGKPIKRFSLWSYRPVEQEEVSPEEMIEAGLDDYENNRQNVSGSTVSERVDQGMHEVLIKYKLFQ